MSQAAAIANVITDPSPSFPPKHLLPPISSLHSHNLTFTHKTATMVDLRGPQQPAYGTDDTHRYTQPPPAYGGDSSPLLGTPRTSEDNVSLPSKPSLSHHRLS